MMDFKKYLPISLPILYVGLKNNWITTKDVVNLINLNSISLNLDENTLLDININEDEKKTILKILHKPSELVEHSAVRAWQLAYLFAIEQSKLSVHDKLKEIELQWSRFEYPESWRSFIYYMPNERVSSEEGLYQNFLNFLNQEKSFLNE